MSICLFNDVWDIELTIFIVNYGSEADRKMHQFGRLYERNEVP